MRILIQKCDSEYTNVNIQMWIYKWEYASIHFGQFTFITHSKGLNNVADSLPSIQTAKGEVEIVVDYYALYG